MYYKLKKKSNDEHNLKELYDQALHRCFYSYIRALQKGTLNKSLEFLKYRWGVEWVKQKTNTEIIITPSALTRDTYEGKRKAGIDAIITFDKIMNIPQCPLVVNYPYEIEIADDIILTGRWEYIREIGTEQKVMQIMKFKSENNRFQVKTQMNHDLELTAAALAFEENFQTNHNVELAYVDIYKKKIMISRRKANDFDLLRNTVISVVKSIQNDIACISPDKRCYHCEYRDSCSLELQRRN